MSTAIECILLKDLYRLQLQYWHLLTYPKQQGSHEADLGQGHKLHGWIHRLIFQSSRQGRNYLLRHQMSPGEAISSGGDIAQEFAPFIESDRVLFCTGKLPISANHGHSFGLASGKIGVCSDKMETVCHPIIRVFLGPWESEFTCPMSLNQSFHLQQSCSPILGLLWFVPGFVKVDHIPCRLLRVWMVLIKLLLPIAQNNVDL